MSFADPPVAPPRLPTPSTEPRPFSFQIDFPTFFGCCFLCIRRCCRLILLRSAAGHGSLPTKNNKQQSNFGHSLLPLSPSSRRFSEEGRNALHSTHSIQCRFRGRFTVKLKSFTTEKNSVVMKKTGLPLSTFDI